MKKFVTHMLYAIVAYALIYAVIIGYMRISSSETREFCDQLEDNMTLPVLQELAEQTHLQTELLVFPENKGKILVVKKATDSKAACKILLREDTLQQKQFIQHIF